jgi:hypothetical protein
MIKNDHFICEICDYINSNFINSKFNLIVYLDIEYEDKLQRLRKKIWPRNSVSKSNTFNQHLNSLISSPSVTTTSTTTKTTTTTNSLIVPKQSNQTDDDFNTKLVKKISKQSNEQPTDNQFRSTSLNYVGTIATNEIKQTEVEMDSAAGGSTSSSSSISMTTSKLKHNYNNNATSTGIVNSTSLTNATLRPFYNKLKKTHLFGVKLEKLCGTYNVNTNNTKLPIQILSLMEKVASEGSTCLMIFRKSASAKLKKVYKEKLDSNQFVDYNEMNVHVAALLLKEYLRDYPDGIIDYRLYNDFLSILKIIDQDIKCKTTQK